jgi:hypothetical protein
MASHSQERDNKEFNSERENGAEYYLGFSEEGFNGQEEANAPYKLEPNATEIEDFLTRLRQEGL